MQGNLAGYNATNFDPNVGYNPVPAGDYTAMIAKSEIKPTNAGDGTYLELTWQIIDGEFQGREIWQRITTSNPSDKATEIGMRELSNVCHAVGVLQPQDSAELHDKPCVITVKVVPPRGEYEASNDIKSCAALGSTSVSNPAGGAANPWQQPAAQAAPAQQAPAQQQQAAPTAAVPQAAQAAPAATASANPPWKR